MKHTAQVGSISSGTLRTEDLLETFAWELRYLSDAPDHAKLCSEADEVDPDSEEARDILSELEDALQELAPPYCYFSAHESDGADFGFWPIRESIEELPRVQDSDGARALGEDCAFVNDHGNVTVYSGDGSILLELI